MKNITFSAQEEVIEKARKIAASNNSTLNDMFRKWLKEFSYQERERNVSKKLQNLWDRTHYFQVGKKLSREEMNER
jgi:hypothetical protein